MLFISVTFKVKIIVYMQKKNKNKKGFAALIVIMISAIMATLAILTIEFGRTSLNVANEKQSLDTCSISLGQSIIATNNIQHACNEEFLNSCAHLVDMPNPNFYCEELDLVCDENDLCKREFKISSEYNPGRGNVTKTTIVSVLEEKHDVNIINAAVIMLLDYSGSMSGNRIAQLKSTVSQFISADYNLSYSVILYNEGIIEKSFIDKGLNHRQTVQSIVNNRSPGGGTNFVRPLQEAMSQIQSTEYEAYYILLISDGSPNEGTQPSQIFVQNNIHSISNNNCIYTTKEAPCITVYTLGVDNANSQALQHISGNTLSTLPEEFSFTVSVAQVSAAFNAIIEEIMCRIGPVIADGTINVFNNTTMLQKDLDYVYDDLYKIIKFYDSEPFNICTNMINNNTQLTIRWGKPEVYVEH